MALVEVNGHGVVDGRLVFPRSGAWHLNLRVDTQEPIAGAVTVSVADGRLVLKGTVDRGADYVDTAFVRIVAGANGLRRPARARSYNQSSLRIVLGDLLAGAGEKLSTTADGPTLSRPLAAWTTAGMATGAALELVMRAAAPAATWRVLPDGSFWVGPETWPDSGLTPDDYQILDEDPTQLCALLGVEAPLLLPGTALAGRRVSRVEHVIDGEGVRSWAWFEDVTGSAPAQDRLKDAFDAMVRATRPVDFHALYWARVIAQSGSTIDVEIENPTVAKFLPSMSRVPLTMPAAGATVQMAASGRVLIGWGGGDPSKPYALAPDADTVLTKLVLNAAALFLGGEPGAEPVIKGTTYRTFEDAYLNAIVVALQAALTACVPPLGIAAGPTSPGSVLALAQTAFATAAPTFLATKTKVT